MKTISINGVAVVTSDGEGKGWFEFQPDDPEGQQLVGFRSEGSGQLMRDGTFYFTGTKRKKGGHRR